MRMFWVIPFSRSKHKWSKRTLFIRTKHKMRIFGVIPFIKLQNESTHKRVN